MSILKLIGSLQPRGHRELSEGDRDRFFNAFLDLCIAHGYGFGGGISLADDDGNEMTYGNGITEVVVTMDSISGDGEGEES